MVFRWPIRTESPVHYLVGAPKGRLSKPEKRFLGMNREQVREEIDRASVFCLPSESEPFGIAALEAAGAGLPVVLTQRSGVAEYLRSARLVDPDSPEAIAAHLVELLRDPLARSREGQALAAEARALSWERSAHQVVRLYRDVLSRVG